MPADPAVPPLPPAPRVLAGAGALVVLALFTVSGPLGLAAGGTPIAAVALALTSLPLVAFLGALALRPATLQRALNGWTAIDLRDPGHVGAAVIMACTLFLVLGYGALVSGIAAVETVAAGGRTVLESVDGNALFAGLLQNLIILTLPPLLYVAFVHGGGPTVALRRLGLHGEGATRATVVGLAAAFAVFLLLALVSTILLRSGIPEPQNERALAIAKSVTVLGAVGLAAGAALSEEIFFRGFLQPRTGLLLQAAIFSLAHLSYVSLSQLIVVFLLGLLFGILYRRTGNLMAPIAAHFLFNLLNLLAAQLTPT